MFDPADLASVSALGALSRSHAAGPASTSLVSDAETCPTRKTLRPLMLKQPVVAPALAGALVTMTIVDVPGTVAILFHLTILAGLAAPSRRMTISLVTSSASFCSLAFNSGSLGIDTYLIPEPMGTCVEMLWFWSQNPWEINSFLAFALSRVVGKG
jgi:hypothetical protein